MKKIIGYAVAALLVAGMVFLLLNNKKKIRNETQAIGGSSEILVETLPVSDETYTIDVSANGLTVPVKELRYVSEVSGRVVKIMVDNGSKVSNGTVLLEIDKELLQADYEASKSAYESLQKNVERFISSNEVGGVSDQQLESLQSQLIAAKSRYDVSKRRLSDATVRSPMNGVINMRFVETGSLIAPATPLFDIVDNSKLKVTCNLPEKKLAHVKLGQKVTFTQTGSIAEYTGRVSFVGVKADRGLNYPVEIVLDNDKSLMPGMYLKANFSAGSEQTGILIPRRAIVGGVKSSMVYLYKDGKAVAQNVTLGEMISDKLEILSGLEDGDVIIISGLMNISDRAAVKSIN